MKARQLYVSAAQRGLGGGSPFLKRGRAERTVPIHSEGESRRTPRSVPKRGSWLIRHSSCSDSGSGREGVGGEPHFGAVS